MRMRWTPENVARLRESYGGERGMAAAREAFPGVRDKALAMAAVMYGIRSGRGPGRTRAERDGNAAPIVAVARVPRARRDEPEPRPSCVDCGARDFTLSIAGGRERRCRDERVCKHRNRGS